MVPTETHHHDRSNRRGGSTGSGTQQATQREIIHLRNYDYQRAYDLDIELLTTDGEAVYRDRIYLQPGHTETIRNAVPTGEYTLHVVLDNHHRKTMTCRIDATPDQTAVIEVGNGALSLTDGHDA